MKLIGVRSGKGYPGCNGIGRCDMNRACEKSGDSPMPITFLRLPPSRGVPVSLVIPKPGSSDSPDGKKNSLRELKIGTLLNLSTFYSRIRDPERLWPRRTCKPLRVVRSLRTGLPTHDLTDTISLPVPPRPFSSSLHSEAPPPRPLPLYTIF